MFWEAPAEAAGSLAVLGRNSSPVSEANRLRGRCTLCWQNSFLLPGTNSGLDVHRRTSHAPRR